MSTKKDTSLNKRKDKRIAIVEDEAVIGLTLAKAVRKMGYDVAGIFETGEEFLEHFASNGIDLVLMDVMLAGELTGTQTASLATEIKEVPIIFITAYSNDDIITDAMSSRPYGYLIKPIDQRELEINIEIAFHTNDLESQLRTSEQRYRQLAESIPEIVVELSGDGKILFINDQGKKHFRIEGEMNRELSIRSFIMPSEIQKMEMLLNNPALQEESANFRFIREDGTSFIGKTFFSKSVADDKDSELRGVIVDITRDHFSRITATLSAQLSYLAAIEICSSEDLIRTTLGCLHDVVFRETAAIYISKVIEDSVCVYSSNGEGRLERETRSMNGGLYEHMVELDIHELSLENSDLRNYIASNYLAGPETGCRNWFGRLIRSFDDVGYVVSVESSSDDFWLSNEEKDVIRKITGILSDTMDVYHIRQMIIRQNNRLFRTQDIGGVGDWTTDIDRGKVDFSSKCAELLGIGMSSMSFDEFASLFTDDCKSKLSNIISDRELREKGQQMDVQTIDGKWFECFIRTGQYVDGENMVHGVLHEITERKLAENTVRSGEARLRSIIDAIPDSLMLVNNNLEILELENRDRNELTQRCFKGTMLQNCIPEPIFDEIEKLTQKCNDPETIEPAEPVEIQYKGKNEKKWVEIRARKSQLGQTMLVFRDITPLKHVLSELNKIMRAVEIAEELVVITDPKGKIQYVNPAFCKVTGFSEKEAMGGTPKLISSGLHKKEFIKEFWDTINSGQPFKGEFINRKKNGSIYIEEKSVTSFLEKGEVVNYISIGRDITDKKAKERRLSAYAKYEKFLDRREHKLRATSLIRGEEKERERLSRDLHDGLGQLLSASLMALTSVESQFDKPSILQPLRHSVEEALEEVKRISYNMLPSVLSDFGLHAGVRKLVNSFADGGDYHIAYKIEGKTRRLNQEIELNFFRVVQEAVANGVKHSSASLIVVKGEWTESSVKYTISDNGYGFNPSTGISSKMNNQGNGLTNMSERAALIGAKFEIDSSPEKGTKVSMEYKFK